MKFIFIMEEEQLKSLLSELKSSSRTRVCKALMKIRQEVIVTNDGIKMFKAVGGIPLLVFMLHKPNEKTLDLVLSILGNCCMDAECANEVVKINGVRYVVQIIKILASNSILCRACRLLGNISQFKPNLDKVHESGAVAALNTLLTKVDGDGMTDKVISPTLLMVIRTIRLLWGYAAQRFSMLTLNVVKNIAKIVVKYTPLWLNNEEKELLTGVLRCVVHFSEFPSHECVSQLAAEGTGFQCLVSLISIDPYIISKIITNFFSVATTRSQLCVPDAVCKIVTSLKQHMELSPCEKWPQNELSALCLFCRYEMGRIEVCNAGGLPIFLSLIKNCSDINQQGQVLHALVHFIYNETSFNILFTEGLVPIAVQCFVNNLKNMKCQHEQKTFEYSISQCSIKTVSLVPKSESESSELVVQTKRSIDDGSMGLPSWKKYRMENNSSPTLSDCQLSPQPSSSCYSPNSSPPRINCDLESDDSVHYSPVCSDSESEDEKPSVEFSSVPFEFEDFIHYELGENELENALKEEAELKSGELRTVSWLLVLLSRASYMEEIDLTFAHSNTLDALLRYMQLSSQPVARAARILLRIVSRWDYLLALLQNNFIVTLHKLTNSLPHTEFCRQCYQLKKFLQILINKLTCVAESGYGKGEIAHYLLRGSTNFKELLSVEIPYLIQSKQLLRVFFTNCGGLELLLNVIIDKKIPDYPSAVAALGLLSTKLKIKDPKCNNSVVAVNLIDGDYKIEKYDAEIVAFKLDDSSIVQAKKDLLIQKSDFFKTLLTGDFKESKEDVICLKNVTKDGLKYLLILLEYTEKNSDVDFPLCLTLSVVLEVLVLLDRYLLENLTDTLTQAVLEHLLVADTAAQVYAWSIDSNTDILRVETIAFGIVGDITIQDRVHIFNSVKQIGYIDQFLDDIRQLLNRYLKIDV